MVVSERVCPYSTIASRLLVAAGAYRDRSRGLPSAPTERGRPPATSDLGRARVSRKYPGAGELDEVDVELGRRGGGAPRDRWAVAPAGGGRRGCPP